MSDFITMVTRIADDINRGSSHHPRIKKAIVDAIKFYRAHRFGFNQKRAIAVLGPGLEFIPLPTDWIEVDHLRLEEGDRRESLNEVTYDWIEERYQGTPTRSEPTDFAIENRELRLSPIPDKTYSLVMSFHYELRDISASSSDAASNAWMTEGEELIRKHAMADLLVTYIGGDTVAQGLAMRHDVSANLVPMLEAQAAREQSSNRIRPFI